MDSLIVSLLFLLVKVNILKTEEFKLDIDPIAPIYWVDKDTIFVNEEERAYIYNVSDREIEETYQKNENQLWGIDKGETYLCTWENRKIDSPEEFSTHLIVKKNSREESLNIELKPTLEVIECKENIVLKTVYPIKEKFFVFEDDLYELKYHNPLNDLYRINKFITTDNMNKYWVIKFKIF